MTTVGVSVGAAGHRQSRSASLSRVNATPNPITPVAIIEANPESHLPWQPPGAPTTTMAAERVRRIRCQDGCGEETYLAVTVRHGQVYLLLNGYRVILDQDASIHLLTAMGECYWCLVHGQFYDDGDASRP